MDSSNLDKLSAGPGQGLVRVFFPKSRVVTERKTDMSSRTIQATRKAFACVSMGLLGTAACMLPVTTPAYAQPGLPEVIRGIPSTTNSTEPRLAYQTSFPNGSLDSSVDKLGVGPMLPGDTGIAGSNPTLEQRPGEIFISITRPVGLASDIIPAMGVWATPVEFGPGTVSRISATYRAPVGPLPGGGFAIGINAKTGDQNDLTTDTRIAVTINVRPGFVVRLNVPFGATAPTAVPLPQAIKDAMFSTTDPQPFTLELTMDRKEGTGTAKLMVADQIFSLSFTLADFLKDGGPAITAVGPGLAVNQNAPGQTASVHVRDFRIYTGG